MRDLIFKFLFALLILGLLTRLFILPNKQYDVVHLKGLLNKQDIKQLTMCFNNNDIKKVYKYRKNKLMRKIKEKMGVKYMNVHHARWSDGTINYDAQTYHRDIKPRGVHNGPYPKVHTIVIFFDGGQHMQGGKLYNVKAGECLVFNSFNLHKGVNMQHFTNVKTKRRRVLQFFHVFFDPEEEKKFNKHHAFANHINSDFVLKYINGLVDTRVELEYYNMVPYVMPSKLVGKNKGKDIKYITLVDTGAQIGKYNGITYFKKF